MYLNVLWRHFLIARPFIRPSLPKHGTKYEYKYKRLICLIFNWFYMPLRPSSNTSTWKRNSSTSILSLPLPYGAPWVMAGLRTRHIRSHQQAILNNPKKHYRIAITITSLIQCYRYHMLEHHPTCSGCCQVVPVFAVIVVLLELIFKAYLINMRYTNLTFRNIYKYFKLLNFFKIQDDIKLL